MQLAGLEGQQVVLLLEDYQFVHPSFLEMINSLLSSGMGFLTILYSNLEMFWKNIICFNFQLIVSLFSVSPSFWNVHVAPKRLLIDALCTTGWVKHS